MSLLKLNEITSDPVIREKPDIKKYIKEQINMEFTIEDFESDDDGYLVAPELKELFYTPDLYHFDNLVFAFSRYPDVTHCKGDFLLLSAIELGLTEIVEFLLDISENKYLRDDFDNTLLHRAARLGHTDTVKLLLDKYYNDEVKYIYESEKEESTALELAADAGHIDTTKLILEHLLKIVDNNEEYDSSNMTLTSYSWYLYSVNKVFNLSIKNKNTKILKLLFKLKIHEKLSKWDHFLNCTKEIDIKYGFDDGRTLLHDAAKNRMFLIMKLLINMGMDPDAKDDDDKTAFDFIKTIYRNPPPTRASFLSSLPKLKKIK